MTSSHSNKTEMLFRSKRFSPFVLVPAILGVLVMVDAVRSVEVMSYPFVAYMIGAVTLWGFALVALKEKLNKAIFLSGQTLVATDRWGRCEIPIAGVVASVGEIRPYVPEAPNKNLPIHPSYEYTEPPQKVLLIECGGKGTILSAASGLSPRRMQAICDRINEAARCR